LLAHFGDRRAHGPLADLAGLPEEQVGGLLGSLITEGLSGLLYATCGGDLERIKQVAANQSADDYARGAAAEALAFAVVDDVATREDVVGFLVDLLSEERLPADVHDYLSWWACFEQSPPTPRPAPRPSQPPARSKRQKAKAKRKRARKARRRQRRR